MYALLRKALLLGVAVVLAGCGGGSIGDGARLRFFDAFTSTEDVRVYVDGNLYSSGTIGPRLRYGGDVAYIGVSSGSVDIVANAYIDLSVPIATLAAQTLVKDARYTAVGLTSSGTDRILLFEDDAQIDSDNAFFRFINASTTYTRLYYTLQPVAGETSGLQGELAVGAASDYQTPFNGVAGSYTLRVYRSSNLTNPVSEAIPIQLDNGRAGTVFFYNGSGGNIRTRFEEDAASSN